MSKFRCCDNKGFQITFANGVTVSVQFGPGNYCEKRDDMSYGWRVPATAGDWSSSDAEIAAWGPVVGAPWLTRQIWEKNTGERLNDDVNGWLNTDQVLTFLNWAAAWDEVKPA